MTQTSIDPAIDEDDTWLRILRDPEERRRRNERMQALLEAWVAEGDPDGTTDEEWDALIKRLEAPELTFRSSMYE